MQTYTFKTYISNRREYFCYGQSPSLAKKKLPISGKPFEAAAPGYLAA